jgi:hypothetical protein
VTALVVLAGLSAAPVPMRMMAAEAPVSFVPAVALLVPAVSFMVVVPAVTLLVLALTTVALRTFAAAVALVLAVPLGVPSGRLICLVRSRGTVAARGGRRRRAGEAPGCQATSGGGPSRGSRARRHRLGCRRRHTVRSVSFNRPQSDRRQLGSRSAGTRTGARHRNRANRRKLRNGQAEAWRVDRQSPQHDEGSGGNRQSPQDQDQSQRRGFSHLCSAYRQYAGQILSGLVSCDYEQHR